MHCQILMAWSEVEVDRAFWARTECIEDANETDIDVVGDCLLPVLRKLNERAISIEEVKEAVKEMK